MKTLTTHWKNTLVPALLGLTLAAGLVPAAHAVATSPPTWQKLTNAPPEQIGLMLLLTDGRVMAQGYTNNTWYALTPTAAGSYVNGTWSTLAPMVTQRLFFTSQVLRNGDVLIAGGEYSNQGGGDFASNFSNTCEIYHPQTNTWGTVPTPKFPNGNDWPIIGDSVGITLADGRVLLGNIYDDYSALYDYTTNTWTPSGRPLNGGTDEDSWALLPDGSVLTVDCDNSPPVNGPNTSERYLPDIDSWVSAPNTPNALVETASAEIGSGMLLPTGSVLFTGASGHTALYSPTSNSWVAGPDQFGTDKTTLLAMKDSAACVEVNGKVLLVTAPDANNVAGAFPAGQHFLEYTFDATASHGSLAEVSAPSAADGYVQNRPAYLSRMLQLPTGQVLFLNTSEAPIFAYTPDSGPNPAWAPNITGITARTDGSYLIKGTQFNGLSMGANYGDDNQMASNYPLVQLEANAGGAHYYGRTYNHSTMGVATGTAPVSTVFSPPPTLRAGGYKLFVVANGISSSPVAFVEPLGLASLTVSPGSVAVHGPVTGTVTLNGFAPSGGLNVALSTSSSAVAAPSVTYVTVPAGTLSTIFTINASAVGTVTLKGIQGKNVRAVTLSVTP